MPAADRDGQSAPRLRPLEASYYLAVVIAVVPFGSVHAAPQAVATLCFAVLAAVSATRRLPGPVALDRFLLAVVTIAIGLVAWILAQTIPLDGTAWLRPHAVWQTVAPLLGPLPATISANPEVTVVALLALVMPALAAATTLLIFRDDAAAMRLWRFLTTFGAVVAGLGILQYFLAPRTLLIFDKQHYLGDLTLVFVNRNTAATFLGVALVLVAARSLQLYTKRLRDGYLAPGPSLWPGGAAAFVILLALFLTRSRAGIAATFAGLLLGGMLAMLRYGRGRSRATPWLVAGGGLICVTVAILLFGGQVMERVEQSVAIEDTRWCIYGATLQALSTYWPYGTGFGTFADVIPAYRNGVCGGLYGVWDRAHDVYLEFALGVGVPVAVAVLGALYTLLLSGYGRGWRRRRRMAFAPIAGFALLTLLTLHSLVDFSLQIPGMAVYAVAGLIAALVPSLGERAPLAPDAPKRRAREERGAAETR